MSSMVVALPQRRLRLVLEQNALSQQTRETEEVRQKLHAKEEELNTVLKNATQSDDVEV